MPQQQRSLPRSFLKAQVREPPTSQAASMGTVVLAEQNLVEKGST